MQIHTPTVVQKEAGLDGPPPPPPLEFFICCSISKRFHLQWKAFDPQDEAYYMGGRAAEEL